MHQLEQLAPAPPIIETNPAEYRLPTPTERHLAACALEQEVDHATLTRLYEGSLPDYCQ